MDATSGAETCVHSRFSWWCLVLNVWLCGPLFVLFLFNIVLSVLHWITVTGEFYGIVKVLLGQKWNLIHWSIRKQSHAFLWVAPYKVGMVMLEISLCFPSFKVLFESPTHSPVAKKRLEISKRLSESINRSTDNIMVKK